MDIRHLRYFISMVESGSLSEASRRLHIVQSALSQRLAQLEEQLGVELFVRGHGGLAVTEAGSELYVRATAIVKQLDAAQTAVREKAGTASGRVAVGLLRTVSPIVAGPLFLAIREALPRVEVEIVAGYSTELQTRLKTSQLDLAMQVLSPTDKPKKDAFLYRERLCLVGAASLVPGGGEPLPLAGLAGIPLVLSAQQPASRLLAERAADQGVALNVIGGVEDTAAVDDICRAGIAATLRPESVAARLAQRAGLAWAVLDDAALSRRVVIAHNEAVMKTGAVVAVESILVRLLEDLVRPGIAD